MGLIQNNLCWKCNSQEGTFLHLMWECSLIFPFWKKVIGKLAEWLGLYLNPPNSVYWEISQGHHQEYQKQNLV